MGFPWEGGEILTLALTKSKGAKAGGVLFLSYHRENAKIMSLASEKKFVNRGPLFAEPQF